VTVRIGSVSNPSRTFPPVAHVYKTEADALGGMTTYYFCCEGCGNCGRRWTSKHRARSEAVEHIKDHPLPEV